MASLQTFKDSFSGIVAIEGDADYSIRRWVKNAERQAKYIAYPKSFEDISKAIKFATTEKLDLAIRGGGHSTAGTSSSEGGIVIDLSKFLNGVRIDPDAKLAYVQGGAIWETVDVEAIKHGLAACAGVANDTGVGGLSTGGGFGYQVGLHGLVVDNIVSATVVTANGDILSASESENPDLFWGIRGGGSNFGVVGEFVFRLHEQRRDVYTFQLFFAPSALPAIISEVREWLKTRVAYESLFVVFAANPADGQDVVYLGGHRNCDEAEGVESVKRFIDLGPFMQQCEQLPYEKLNGMLNALSPWGRNMILHGTRVPPGKVIDTLQTAWDARLKLVEDHPTTATTAIFFEFYHLDKMASVPVNATAVAGRTTDINAVVGLAWEDPSFAPLAREASRKLAESVTKLTPELNKDIGYGNFADAEALCAKEDRTAALFGANYPRLQQIKRKYDPDMVFNKWFPIVPAQVE